MGNDVTFVCKAEITKMFSTGKLEWRLYSDVGQQMQQQKQDGAAHVAFGGLVFHHTPSSASKYLVINCSSDGVWWNTMVPWAHLLHKHNQLNVWQFRRSE